MNVESQKTQLVLSGKPSFGYRKPQLVLSSNANSCFPETPSQMVPTSVNVNPYDRLETLGIPITLLREWFSSTK